MDGTPKRGRGRPKKTDEHVFVGFNMQREQAEYLLALGRRFGWGTEINEVVRSILAAEIIALQKAEFHKRGLPQDET